MTNEEKAQKLLDDLGVGGKIKELLDKRFPYEFAGDQSGIDAITKQIEDLWFDKVPSSDRKITGWTGRGGAILGQVYMHEAFSGKKYSKEEHDAKYKEIEESQIWEDGIYEIGGKYVGLEDTEREDGVIVVKDNRGVWRVEEWKNHWRTNYRLLTEEEAYKMIEEHGGKPKTDE